MNSNQPHNTEAGQDGLPQENFGAQPTILENIIMKPQRPPVPNGPNYKGNDKQASIAPAVAIKAIEARKLPTNIYVPTQRSFNSLLNTQTVLGAGSIAEQARALKNDVDLIFEFCNKQIEFAPNFGLHQGAKAALLAGIGNSFDTTELMVQLLRAAGHTANFVFGTVRLHSADWANWLGCDPLNVSSALNLLANGFIPNTATWTGTEWIIDMSHLWLQVDIGGTNYVFDPSRKLYTYTTGVDLTTATGFNESTFLSNASSGASITADYVQDLNRSNIRSDLGTYTTNLIDWIQTNRPDAGLSDIIGGRSIDQPTLGLRQTSLGYETPGSTPTIWTDIPNSYKGVFQVEYDTINVSFYSSDISDKRLSLFFNASHEAELSLDGTLIATSSAQGIGTWNSVLLTATHPYAVTWADQAAWHQIWTDKPYTILHSFGPGGRAVAEIEQNHVRTQLLQGASATSEPVLGSTLASVAFMWNEETTKVADILDQMCGVCTVTHHNFGVFGHYDTMLENIGGASWNSSALDNNYDRVNYHRTALAIHGVTLEAAVIAEMTRVGGVSTTPIIDIANQAGLKIYSATSANWTTIRPLLTTYDTATLDDIENYYINWGWKVYLPESALITKNSWTGLGYFAVPVSPYSGTIGIIGGGLKGGSGDDPETLTDLAYDAWLGVGLTNMIKASLDRELDAKKNYSPDPVSLKNGAFEHFRNDISVGSGSFPYMLSFSRRYNSQRVSADGPLGLGWKHSLDAICKESSSVLAALGQDSVIAAATAIVNFHIATKILTDLTRPSEKYLSVIECAQWWAEQLKGNIVTVETGHNAEIFVKLPDGSFTPESYSASELVKNLDGSFTYKTVEKVAYNYSTAGLLSTIVFPQGVTVTYSYTGGKITSISNGMGRSLSLTYTLDRLTSVSDGTGRSVSFTVDSNKNLTQFTNVAGKIFSYEYDIPGRLTKLYLPANPTTAVVKNVYDSLGRVKEQRDFADNLTTLYLAGNRSEVIGPLGNSHVVYFGAGGVAERSINALGFELTKHYDGRNRLVSVVHPEGNSINFTYDVNSNLLQITHKPKPGSGLSDLTNQLSWDPLWNRLQTFTDTAGRTNSWNYDPTNGRLLSITKHTVNGQTPQSFATYNSRGQMTSITDETGVVTQFNFDSTTELLLSVVGDPGATPHLNITLSFGYNAQGEVTSITDARGFTSSITRDIANRITQSTSPAPFNYVTKMTYDDNGNRIKVEAQTDSISNPWMTTLTAYSPEAYLDSFTSANSGITQIAIDAEKRLESTTNAISQTASHTYDAYGHMIETITPDSQVFETLSYTPNGKQASGKDALNRITQVLYDGFDRLIKRVYADSSFEEFTHDSNSNLLTARTRGGSIITMTYDELDRLKTKTPQGQPTITYVYDLVGRLQTVSTPVVAGDPGSGTFTFFYDTNGRCYKEQSPDGKILLRELNAAGMPTKITFPDGYFIERFYDELSRLTDIKLNGSTVSAVHFDYNPLSQRKKLTFQNGVITDYVYKLDGMIASFKHNFNPSPENVEFTLNTDLVNRITDVKTNDVRYKWNPVSSGTQSFGAVNSTNQYSSVNGVGLTYSADGCLASDGVWTYTYNSEGKLLTANKSGVAVSYLYDPMQRQAIKQVGSVKTQYFYSGWQRIADYDGVSGALLNRYVYGDRPDELLLKISPAGVVTFYSHDHQSSVIGTTDSSGAVISRYGYSPFGETPTSMAESHGFNGQRYDSETGLYYYKHRMYSPALGRFLQPDPLGCVDSYNLYSYVGNDPVNRVDSLGLTWETNFAFLRDFYLSLGADKRQYSESDVETQEVMNSALGDYIHLMALGVGWEYTKNTVWDSTVAALTTVAPGAGLLASASVILDSDTGEPSATQAAQAAAMLAMVQTAAPGMWGNTAAQIGGVNSGRENNEMIEMWRIDANTVHIRMTNIANADSFFLHASKWCTPELINVVKVVNPDMGAQLEWLRAQALNENKSWRPITQVFDWEVYSPYKPWRGYCTFG